MLCVRFSVHNLKVLCNLPVFIVPLSVEPEMFEQAMPLRLATAAVGETISNSTRAIQKVKNAERLRIQSRICFVAAYRWFLVLSVILKSCIMQLYVGACHVVNAEIAVAIIPYSPYLALSDFFLFPKMEHLAGKRFANDEDLKDAVVTWLNNQATTWHEEGIHKLVPRYDKSLNIKGEYVER